MLQTQGRNPRDGLGERMPARSFRGRQCCDDIPRPEGRLYARTVVGEEATQCRSHTGFELGLHLLGDPPPLRVLIPPEDMVELSLFAIEGDWGDVLDRVGDLTPGLIA